MEEGMGRGPDVAVGLLAHTGRAGDRLLAMAGAGSAATPYSRHETGERRGLTGGLQQQP
jgi:hypothetical protein